MLRWLVDGAGAAAAGVGAGAVQWLCAGPPRRVRAFLRRPRGRAAEEAPAHGLLGAGAGRLRAAWARASGRGVPPVAAQVPLTAELLASCLASGALPGRAAEAVAEAVGAPMSALLRTAAAELRMGADPAECWARFGQVPGLAPLGRCLARAAGRGVAPAEAVAALAERRREEAARAAGAAARRASVLATAPLGLCFLPAFLLVGVAPVVIGLLRGLLR